MKNLLYSLWVVLASGCAAHTPPIITGYEGKQLPDFTLLLSDSNTHISSKEMPSGKPIVLFYFGPACPYSRAQMADIIKNINSLQDIRFYIFTSSPFRDMQSFYKFFHLEKYPNISVGIDYDSLFSTQFSPPGVPYTAICHSDKKLSAAFLGTITIDQIKKASQ